MQLIVLGMHRSGTSALARVLGRLGCHLGGPDAFHPARPDNPHGDWERRDVWEVNERTLACLRASWCKVSRFDLTDLEPADRRDLEARVAAVVRRVDPLRPWAIKDPRLCLTLPLWRPALTDPVCVEIVRSPLEVARSLAARDGLPESFGFALWERYVRAAAEGSAGMPRVRVAHRELMTAPGPAVRRLVEDLAQVGLSDLTVPEKGMEAVIDRALYRARAGSDEEQSLLPTVIRQLFEQRLEPGASAVAGSLSAGSAAELDRLASELEATPLPPEQIMGPELPPR